MAHFLSKAHFRIDQRQSFFHMAQQFWHTYIDRTKTQTWAGNLEFHCTHNLLGCLLARSIGKSPLEYLNASQRQIQKTVVVSMMLEGIDTMTLLFQRFKEQLHHHGQN